MSERLEPIETYEVLLDGGVAPDRQRPVEQHPSEPYPIEPPALGGEPAVPAASREVADLIEEAADESAEVDERGDEEAPDDEPVEASPDPTRPDYQRFDCTVDDAAALAEAAEAARKAIERGECIVLPTDTVYGIGADAFNDEAIQRLLDAKVRGRDMPPPVLIAMPTLIRALAVDVPPAAKDLVAKHWPGALTVICKIQPSLKMDLGETEGTIALRVPDHELTREILRRTGPMAVSSANISGLPAALTCDEAIDQLGNSVAVYLDAGRVGASGTAPSTMVDFTQSDHGEVLRHGALSVELLRETCPDLVDLVTDANESEPPTGESGRERTDAPDPPEAPESNDAAEPTGRPTDGREPCGEPGPTETTPTGASPDPPDRSGV